ncbi:MAG: TetR/AcrR family transcriptional regulator [Deltaproteobacteria bacterium]
MTDKSKILEHSARLFLRLGIRNVTMDDIANDLGISKRTLYEHFESKESIISKIVDFHIENEKYQFEKIQNESKNAIEMMIRLSDLIFHMYNKLHPSVMSDLKKHYTESWKSIESFHTEAIREIIEQNIILGIREGLYRIDIDPVVLSLLFVKQLQLFSDDSNIHLEKKSKPDIIQQFFDYNMYGLLSKKGIDNYRKIKTNTN